MMIMGSVWYGLYWLSGFLLSGPYLSPFPAVGTLKEGHPYTSWESWKYGLSLMATIMLPSIFIWNVVCWFSNNATCTVWFYNNRLYKAWLLSGGSPTWDFMWRIYNGESDIVRMAIWTPPKVDTCPVCRIPLGQNLGNYCSGCQQIWDNFDPNNPGSTFQPEVPGINEVPMADDPTIVR
jgi:hypothetical protein